MHKHNVKFDDSSGLVEVDGGTEKFWFIPSKLTYYWIHDKAREEYFFYFYFRKATLDDLPEIQDTE